MQSRNLYLAVAIVALIVALWLTLQIAGALLKLLFVVAIAAVGFAALRAWQSGTR